MRYKEFNTQRVLEDCISLFWACGFGGCTIKDIVQKTNVNRFSLYEEFENKEGLLHASIELYKERYSSKHQKILNSNKQIKETLREFYISFLSDSNTHPPGDYILHISTELADGNEKIKQTLDNYLNALQSTFKSLLHAYPETKERADFLAKHLIALYCTSNCFCVIHPYKKRVSIVDNGLNILLSKNSIYV